MKCPKCHYLSFDPEPRCRNCGFTMALDPELALRPSTDDRPLEDLALRLDAEPSAAPVVPATESGDDVAPPETQTRAGAGASSSPVGVEALAARLRGRSSTPAQTGEPHRALTNRPRVPSETRQRRTPHATSELPLFVKGMAVSEAPAADSEEVALDEAAMRAKPSDDRQATLAPGAGRKGGRRSMGPLDHDLLEGLRRIEHEERNAAGGTPLVSAGPARRLLAAIVDVGLLSLIGLAVAWLTLRWVEVDAARLPISSAVPLAGFVLVIVLAYLTMFTAAGGQTIGKMLARIRVVGAADGAPQPLTLRQALIREVVAVPSVLFFGAGFVPGLIGDERAVHDRVTESRVVRV
jgi:uncharacterized RDD family membrane protein YckC